MCYYCPMLSTFSSFAIFFSSPVHKENRDSHLVIRIFFFNISGDGNACLLYFFFIFFSKTKNYRTLHAVGFLNVNVIWTTQHLSIQTVVTTSLQQRLNPLTFFHSLDTLSVPLLEISRNAERAIDVLLFSSLQYCKLCIFSQSSLEGKESHIS